MVVATGDVHSPNPEDEVYRRILMKGKGFADCGFAAAALIWHTTEEMLEEFFYLGDEKAREVVITNPKPGGRFLREYLAGSSG